MIPSHIIFKILELESKRVECIINGKLWVEKTLTINTVSFFCSCGRSGGFFWFVIHLNNILCSFPLLHSALVSPSLSIFNPVNGPLETFARDISHVQQLIRVHFTALISRNQLLWILPFSSWHFEPPSKALPGLKQSELHVSWSLFVDKVVEETVCQKSRARKQLKSQCAFFPSILTRGLAKRLISWRAWIACV